MYERFEDMPLDMLENFTKLLERKYPPAFVRGPAELDDPKGTHKLAFAAGQNQVAVDARSAFRLKSERKNPGQLP